MNVKQKELSIMGKDYKLGIITYEVPHQKTEFILLSLLKKYKVSELKIFALPFVPRSERQVLFPHRPDQTNASPAKEYADAFSIAYSECSIDTEITDDCSLYLILCGKLLSRETVRNKRIINVHPGIIPICKGLDAFKWAIHDMKPLGLTMHYIDENVDEGKIISIVKTPVFASDSLQNLAWRHYQNELIMTSNFEWYLTSPKIEYHTDKDTAPTRRMPLDTERELSNKFVEYKKIYAE